VVTIRIPVPSSMLVSNLVGLLGLVAVVVAVGLLAGFAWALLGAGVIAVALCALAQNAAARPVSRAAGASLKAVPPAGKAA
jgi:hypothetical protein